MSRRDQRIEVRVSTEEKACLMTAAGGARLLSAWLRDLALKTASASAVEGDPASPGDAVDAASGTDQTHRESRPLPATQARGDDSSSGERTSSSVGGPKTCPRWMHHRPGVYCGACKKVVK